MRGRSRRGSAGNLGAPGGSKRASVVSGWAGITFIHAHANTGGVDGTLDAIVQPSRVVEGEGTNRTGQAGGCPGSSISAKGICGAKIHICVKTWSTGCALRKATRCRHGSPRACDARRAAGVGERSSTAGQAGASARKILIEARRAGFAISKAL